MPTASDVVTLLAYESEILPGWVELLRQRGVNAFVEFSDETKLTPFVDVFLDHVNPEGHQHFHVPDQRAYWDAWKGYLIHRIYTQRGTNSDQQAPILKEIRKAAFDFADTLDDSILPYHDILFVKESPHGKGLSQGVDHTFNLDWSELPFDIQFCVRPDSWP